MAKKKESLSLEEKLEQALVPDWEQPYKVPENWCWTYGETVFLPMTSKKPSGDTFLYIDIDSVDNHRQLIKEPKRLAVVDAPSRASRELDTGDTLFSLVRPYLKNIAYIDDTLCDAIASTGFFVCKPNKINNRYIYWLMCSGYVIDGLNRFMKGDNSPSIKKSDIEKFAFPLPPLSEQHRIVARIESLFAKLDEAKELAQSALDSFETRKAAILHQAFTGELTKGWREVHGIGMESWESTVMKNICHFITKGETPSKFVSKTGEIPFLKVYNIRNNSLDFQHNSSFIPLDIHNGRMKRSKVFPNDVIMNIVGPPLQKVAIITDEYNEWNINQAIAIFRAKENASYKYLYYYLLWDVPLADVLRDLRGVVGQSNISLEQCRNIMVKLPTLPEQTEIVRILDTLFAKETQAKELTNVITQIDLMKKSILARAFRGELGTNIPEEDSALGLLREILTNN